MGEPAIKIELPHPYSEHPIILRGADGELLNVLACVPGGWKMSPPGFVHEFREGVFVVLPAGVKISRLEVGDPSNPEVKEMLSKIAGIRELD